MKKSLKKQAVFPVLMLLVVTALALIGSSFAWFAMTNVASVSAFQANIEQGSTGLMISANGNDYVGSVTLANADSTTDKTVQLSTSWIKPNALHQVSTKDGVNFFEAEIKSKAQDGTVSTITSKADLSHPAANMTAATATTATDKTAHIIVFDLYFQVDVNSYLYLNYPSAVTTYTNDAHVDTAQNAIRVAFLYCGTATTTSAIKTTGYTNNANYIKIWKPVADEYTTYGLIDASDTAFAAYSAVDTIAEGTTEYTGTAIVPTSDLSQAESIPSGLNSIATLTAGYNKIRVLVWLEGQDRDCIVDIAKGAINVSLNFYAQEIPSTNP